MSARRAKVWLGERVDLDRVSGRVDRDAHVIAGVKVLGLESRNKRRYTLEAVQKAAPLYEGVSVRANHPKRASDQRDVDDVLGWLSNVRVTEDGLYADLHVLESHPLSERLYEAAERKPDLFGLSHNADGATETKGGETVVLEIAEVRSVDLVADPATVSGLFEGRGSRVTTKLKAFMEAAGRKLAQPKRKLLLKLFEDDYMQPDQELQEAPPEDTAGPEDHQAALRTGFEGSISSIVGEALDGTLDPKEAIKKIKELLSTHAKLSDTGSGGGGGASEPDDDTPVEEGEECDEDKTMKESVELRYLRREKKARVLCEQAGVEADSVLLEALARLPNETAMRRMVEREKKRGGATGTAIRPRTGPLVESGRKQPQPGHLDTRQITDGKGFAAALRAM